MPRRRSPFTPDGRLKILDFGLAKLVGPAGDRSLTESSSDKQVLLGPLPYMAPEQARAGALEGRTDICAAGLVLCELATGRRTFPEPESAALL